jgi:hypothetical protein
MHNITGYISVFESSKTVQYSRRYGQPKSAQKSVDSFAIRRPCRGSIFRRASPPLECSVFTQTCSIRVMSHPSHSNHQNPRPEPPMLLAILVQSRSRKQIQFSVFRTAVSSSRFPASFSSVTVHLFEPFHLQSNHGTPLLLNHSSSAQIRRPLRRHLRPKSRPESVQYSVSSVQNSVKHRDTLYLV